jgi:signal transduction histidine kinase
MSADANSPRSDARVASSSGVNASPDPSSAESDHRLRRSVVSWDDVVRSRVLIVDDEPNNLLLLRRVLERNGFSDVHTTADSRSVATLYGTLQPDIILLDLRMPELDGFGVLTELGQIIPRDVFLPIVMLTGDAEPSVRRQALRLGARDFILKPFDASEIVLRIVNLLETRLLHRSLQVQNAELEDRVHERTAQLEAALETANAANRTKSDFLARVSHELRTPLNSVIGFTNVLMKNKSGNLRPQDIAYLERIGSNGKHLLGLIDDILDLSKVEAGKMELEMGTVMLEDVIYETLEELEGKFIGSTLVPRVSLPPVLVPIQSDAAKLKQVLVNLLGNALRFTEAGMVKVAVIADPATHRPQRIDIIDTGIGIPADRLTAIFEPFEQAQGDTSRKYGGTGLGLTISRALCEMMGYKLEVVSEEGVGSTFSIVLS